MQVESIKDLDHLPISTSPEDLGDRINTVFELIEKRAEGSAADFAQAFSDVIGYQSYAGDIPEQSQEKLINWVRNTYEQSNLPYVDAVASILCMCNSQPALDCLHALIGLTNNQSALNLLKESVAEIEINT
ncbi:hypothetical protein NBRC116493_27740 [Aurantivibrio infirmus]